MRGNADARARGARETLAPRRRGLRRLGAHPRGARGRRRPRRPRPRGAAGRRRRRVRPASRATRRSPALLEEARADPPNPGNANERLPDEGNAERLAAFLAGDEPTVVYFGKLLYNKGVHVLLEALRGVDARAVIVGFGDYREELEAMAPPAARSSPARSSTATSSTCSRSPTSTVVPSIFPEAFGMVAAEAAAAGSPPLVARHSGLAEVADGLEAEYPPELRHLAASRPATPPSWRRS